MLHFRRFIQMRGPRLNVAALMSFRKNRLFTFILTLRTFIEMASTFIFAGNTQLLCAHT
jgi:hypothetical protein